jgi:hypothetical protein
LAGKLETKAILLIETTMYDGKARYTNTFFIFFSMRELILVLNLSPLPVIMGWMICFTIAHVV